MLGDAAPGCALGVPKGQGALRVAQGLGIDDATSCTCDDSTQNYNNGAIAIDQTMYGWAMEFLDNFVS